MKCKWCNNKVDLSRLNKYASGEFCSTRCARSYSQSAVDTQSLKTSLCIDCGKEIGIKKNASSKKSRCDNCKNKKICKICGQEKPCKRPDICKKYQLFPTLIKHFGFDESKIGTIEIYEEFERIRNMLIEDYGDKELSTLDMVKKYNHSNQGTFHSILKSMRVDKRSHKDAVKLAGKNNKLEFKNVHTPNNTHKQGWHKTGNGKDVFYRSSYELEYAEQLDEQKIDYEMENLRILYGDNQLLRQRVAIPDFYLPESNIIVEVKSNGTYDEQNIKDKVKAYKEHGYNCKLMLEKKDTTL